MQVRLGQPLSSCLPCGSPSWKSPQGPRRPPLRCCGQTPAGGTQGKENTQKNILAGSKHTLLPAAPPFPYLLNPSLFSLGGCQCCPAFSGAAAPSPPKSSVLQAPRSKLCFAVSMLPPRCTPRWLPGGSVLSCPPRTHGGAPAVPGAVQQGHRSSWGSPLRSAGKLHKGLPKSSLLV